jgi:hypothetical protein
MTNFIEVTNADDTKAIVKLDFVSSIVPSGDGCSLKMHWIDNSNKTMQGIPNSFISRSQFYPMEIKESYATILDNIAILSGRAL